MNLRPNRQTSFSCYQSKMTILSLDSHAQCAGEVMIGFSPLSYFIIGCIEIAICSFLALVIIKRNFLPSVNQATRINFLLPVYLTVVIFLVSLGILMGADRIIGIYPTNVVLTIGRWFILRSCTEGLSIFFRQAGIGFSSVKMSIVLGTIWSLIDSLILLAGLLIFGFDVFVYLCIVVGMGLMTYYCIMWLAPYELFHRRPAATSFALLNVLILIAQIATIVSYLAGDKRSNSSCAVELMFSIAEFVQLAIMLYAFLLDSMFWQGLYSNEHTNLNLPMLGMWDMNDRNTVKMVTESIAHLERKVVYIIPFSQLRVDTSKFFSGGSARVYRGKYQDMEVAIKFLFCMELTPGRVVEFCNEATLLNSLQHENIVHCHGVAIMPPAISLVTEFCTYGSLFDFLHSMDWMVTDERLSASVQSWTTDRDRERERDTFSHTGQIGSSQNSSIGSGTGTLCSGSGVPPPGVIGLQSSGTASFQPPLLMNATMANASAGGDATTAGSGGGVSTNNNYPRFTKLSTPPPSPVVTTATKHMSGAGALTKQLFRPVSIGGGMDRRGSNAAATIAEADLEKGESEMSDMGLLNSGGSGKLNSRSEDSSSKASSNADVANRLADAINHQYLADNNISAAADTKSERSSWSKSESFKTSELGGRPRVISTTHNPASRSSGQLQSATSILLTRELGYGMGPARKTNYSFNYTMKSISGTHGSINGLAQSRSIPSVLLSCVSSSVHSLGHLLPTGIKLRMAKECCAGVAYLHSKSIMHCDIKSLNFLVTSSLSVKLADLGEARFENDTDPRKLPRNINWSSPEILMDTPTLQIRSSADIWSLAMVIAEICNGEVPYDTLDCRQMSLEAFLTHLRAGNRPRLSKEFASLQWLNELLECAWSFDPAARCTSEDMLQKFIDNIG